MIDLQKDIITRDGRKVEILTTKRKGGLPLVVLIDDSLIVSYPLSGRVYAIGDSSLDLLNVEQPFSITKPVMTKSGHSVRIIAIDRKDDKYPVVALVNIADEEIILCYTLDGLNSVDINYDLVNRRL